MDYFKVAHTQRAIRRFKPDPVPEDILWRMLDTAIRAPSGSNTQPWAWLVVRDSAKKKAIGDAIRRHRLDKNPLAEEQDPGKFAEKQANVRMLAGASDFYQSVATAPVLVIPCLTRSSTPDYDIRSLLAGASIYGAVQNLMLAGRALGVGSVMTTFNRFADESLRRELHLPDEVVPACLIPIGYPEGQRFGPTTRNPVESVTHWDGWEQTLPRP